MDNPWIIHGWSMHDPWVIHGWSMDDPWMIHGWSMDDPWMIHGRSTYGPWMVHWWNYKCKTHNVSPKRGPQTMLSGASGQVQASVPKQTVPIWNHKNLGNENLSKFRQREPKRAFLKSKLLEAGLRKEGLLVSARLRRIAWMPAAWISGLFVLAHSQRLA